jgi:hypothetical protein
MHHKQNTTPTTGRNHHVLVSTIHAKKKQKHKQVRTPKWTTSTTYLKGVRIEILLNDETKDTDLGWYEGLITEVYNENTVQWLCDDGETLDQIKLTDTQWEILPLNTAQEFLLNNRVRAMKRTRSAQRTTSPRISRKHWKAQLKDTTRQQIRRKYQDAFKRSRQGNEVSPEPKDAKKTKRDQDRRKRSRAREIDRGDGLSTDEETQ